MSMYRVYFRTGPDHAWLREPVRYEGHVASIIATSIRQALKQVGFVEAEAEARRDDTPTVRGQKVMIVSPPK